MTSKAEPIRREVKRLLDYLSEAELALYSNEVSMTSHRVSFHSHSPGTPFLIGEDSPTIDQYLSWVEAGQYSAILLDGSLLQMTYHFDEQDVTGHRLAYVPCPYEIEPTVLASGDAIGDVVRDLLDSAPLLRSPIRFDFDAANAGPDHPAAHFTINSARCRIACIAAMHPMRFADFVFRNFYNDYWQVHTDFFKQGSRRHLRRGTLTFADREHPHFMWEQDPIAQDVQ